MSPATKVIRAFGGVRPLARLMSEAGHPVSASGVCQWARPVARGGRGGLVPSRHHRILLRLAKREGISLKPEDLIDAD